MKKKVEKNAEESQDRISISVKTMVNGYMLEVNDEGYMYFNAQSLLEGFCIHVGLKRLEDMTKDEIRSLLRATIDGSAEKTLQAEVTELKNTIVELKKVIREQKKEIKELKNN